MVMGSCLIILVFRVLRRADASADVLRATRRIRRERVVVSWPPSTGATPPTDPFVGARHVQCRSVHRLSTVNGRGAWRSARVALA